VQRCAGRFSLAGVRRDLLHCGEKSAGMGIFCKFRAKIRASLSSMPGQQQVRRKAAMQRKGARDPGF
jgi:hypothetical protein